MKRKPEPHQRPPANLFNPKSKKAGVELEDLKARRERDVAAFDAMTATQNRPKKPPGVRR